MREREREREGEGERGRGRESEGEREEESERVRGRARERGSEKDRGRGAEEERERETPPRRDETADGRPKFRPHMHTNTMSPVSFGPLSQKNSGNPDRLGHGVDWVTLVSIQFLRLAGSVTCTCSLSLPPQSVCLSSTVRRPVLVITHRSLSSLTPSLNVMAEIVTLANANFLCRLSTVRALSHSHATHTSIT